jgi:hypothetical protein
MLNNNHKNSNCGFSAQIVSYLYDEAEASEKVKFEAHQENCSVCAEEIAAFSAVRFSISDWTEEFSSLETPMVIIPYEKARGSMEKVEASGVTSSWLTALRNLFSLSPAWTAATTFAAVAICLGLALVALNNGTGDIAGTNTPKKPTSNVDTLTRIGASTNQPTPTPSKKEIGTPPKNNKKDVTTISSNPSPAPKPEKAVQNSNNSAPNRKDIKNDVKKTLQNRDEPKLSPYDDEEDDTLRLADLFDEIDTKE